MDVCDEKKKNQRIYWPGPSVDLCQCPALCTGLVARLYVYHISPQTGASVFVFYFLMCCMFTDVWVRQRQKGYHTDVHTRTYAFLCLVFICTSDHTWQRKQTPWFTNNHSIGRSHRRRVSTYIKLAEHGRPGISPGSAGWYCMYSWNTHKKVQYVSIVHCRGPLFQDELAKVLGTTRRQCLGSHA